MYIYISILVHLLSFALLTFSMESTHCSIRASEGAPKKKVLLNVPRLNMCCCSLYSRPTSRFIHSRRSIIFLGFFNDSMAFFDLKHSSVLLARNTQNLSFHFCRNQAMIMKVKHHKYIYTKQAIMCQSPNYHYQDHNVCTRVVTEHCIICIYMY